MSQKEQALQWVKNSAGNSPVGAFIEDFDPIGKTLLYDLTVEGLVYVEDGMIKLVEKAS